MLDRTIYIDGVDFCERYKVLLVDYEIGEIEFEDNEPVSRENSFYFAFDSHIDTWELKMLEISDFIQNREHKVVLPEDYKKYYYGKCRINDRGHKNDGIYYFEIKQEGDPFKYDVDETILSEADGTLKKDSKGQYEIYYGGTAPNHFVLRNRFATENAYLEIVKKDKFFAIGDPDEADAINLKSHSRMLYEQMNDLARWEHNTMDPIFTNAVIQGGWEATKWGVKPTSAYTQEYEQVYHGPSAVIEFEEDVLNETIAESFLADFIVHAQTQGTDHNFCAVVGLLDQNDNMMMNAQLLDNLSGTNQIDVIFEHFDRGKLSTHVLKTTAKEINHGRFRFRKKGNNVDFELVDKNGIDKRVSRYLPGFNSSGRYANKAFIIGYQVGKNQMYTDLDFRLVHVQKYNRIGGANDIVNVFQPNDVFEWDTKTGRRYVNGFPFIDGLHLRSDVSMQLEPGVNHLAIAKSQWYRNQSADNLEIRFRNRYY